ncbi:MAG TPA: YHS domain-containing protein [Nitrospiria bacterium]|jgi:YHS domain-containing protein
MSDVLYFLFIGILFFVMMRWGCGAHMMGGGHGGHHEEFSGKETSRPVQDPVCGERLDARTANFTKMYRGGLYYFCSAQCQEKFQKDPETYIKAA